MASFELLNDQVINHWETVLFEDLEVRPVTRRLVHNLCWDLPLSPAEMTDFGVDHDEHYLALREVLVGDDAYREMENQGIEPPEGDEAIQEMKQIIGELEQAWGNGPKLTALVEKYAPRYSGVIFKTSRDVLGEVTSETESAS